MVVAMIASGPKAIGSTQAMILTEQSSPLYAEWVQAADNDLAEATRAVLDRDLPTLGRVMEASTLRMHATMMSAVPPIRYWTPATVAAMEKVEQIRQAGIPAWFTMDAGPNVKVLCEAVNASAVAEALQPFCEQVDILGAGPDARIL
jgi:diphosphomevalonate decarboxylase